MHPDRIDFTQLKDGRTIVLKLRRDGARDIPTSDSVKAAGFDLEGALEWCEANGYTVRRWGRHDGVNAGARAFRGGPWVIRTTGQIQRKRDRHPCVQGVDFAYDC